MMRSNLYRAVWRWHFYAGIFVLPFLILLSVTGGLYLFKDEINSRLYDDLLHVEPASARLPASSLVRAVSAYSDGDIVGYMPPWTEDSSARVIVDDGAGNSSFVFVDPYQGSVLGEVSRGQFGNLPLMNLIRQLHSLEQVGWLGNRLIEVVAGWALILVLTGVYLWWPRGRRGGVVSVRRNAGRRSFWRDVHAVTGVFASLLIVFMALTGLPWSGVWGDNLKQVINDAGLGYPPGYWFPVVESTVHMHDTVVPAPWTTEHMPLPSSGNDGNVAIDLDTAIELFDRKGMPPGYAVNMPRGSSGVWSASVIPDKVQQSRTMHLDQYSGELLYDARYSDMGAAARAIEWGISVHTGQQFGRLNQWLMLLTCVAILLMSVAAMIMWWQRRPEGRLGAPSHVSGYRIPRGVLVIPVVVGIIFPLVGLSLLAVLAIEASLPAPLRARFN